MTDRTKESLFEAGEEATGEIIGLLKQIKDLLLSIAASSGGGGAHAGEQPAERYQDEAGTWLWKLPTDKKASKCKYCKAEIFWVKSKKGKNIPVNDGGICHYDTCENKLDSRPKTVKEEFVSGEVPF